MSFRKLLFIVAVTTVLGFAQSFADSSVGGYGDSLVIRYPDSTVMQQLRADKQLQYTLQTEQISAWDRFWNWLGDLLIAALPDGIVYKMYNYIDYIIVIVAIIVIALVFKRMKFSGNVYSEGQSFNPDAINIKEVSHIKLDELLDDALTNQDYQRAVLIAYLLLLKKLDSGGVIQWQKSKTNAQFAREISDKRIQLEFLAITRIFDTIKYGYLHFSNEELLETVNQTRRLAMLEKEMYENAV